MMQRSGGSKYLIDGAEDHRKHHFECAVKARDRVCQRPGMVGNGGGNPGMSELKEQRPTGSQKEDGLSVHLPRQ